MKPMKTFGKSHFIENITFDILFHAMYDEKKKKKKDRPVSYTIT